jgi:uncharacterized protein (TIGR03437 family)
LRFLTVAVACAAGASIPASGQSITPTITALTPPAATAGATNQFTLTLTGTNYCGYAYIYFNGTSYNANVISSTSASATIPAAAIAAPGTVPVTFMVGSDANCNNDSATSSSFNFTINPPLTLTPVSLPGGSVGSPYHQTLTASGGTPAYAFSPTGEIEPPFTFGASTLNINFTPANTANYSFNAGLTDNGGGFVNPLYNFTVSQPAAASASQGTPQTTAVGTTFPTALQVLVVNANAMPVQGAQVTFTPPVGGASGSFGGSNVVLTDVNGHATAPLFTANAVAGTYMVTASVIGTSSTPTFTLTNMAIVGPPTSITMFSGGGQSTVATGPFPNPLQAIVKDANSNPVQGVSVTFAAPGSGASGTFGGTTTVITGANGVATSPPFTANTKAGSYNVTATAVAVTGAAAFSLTNNPLPPSVFTASGGTPQAAALNTAFAIALQATVTDLYGNPVSGVQVFFSAPNLETNLPYPSGRFGISTFASVNTNASGVAVAPTFTANGVAGSYVVVGSASFNESNISFNLTNTAATPTSITVFAGSPQSATVNTPFATALQAIAKDVNNNPVPNVAVTFAAPGSGASGAFGGSTTVQTNASGVATAPTFTANATAGAYTVTASTNGVNTPASFSLTNNPGLPASITATAGTPQNTAVNTAFPTLLQATVKDANSNLVPNAQVTFAVPGSGASGTFGGSVVVTTNASGVATAPALTANSTGGAFTATASVTGVATAASFSLTNNPSVPATITATGGTPQAATINTAFATALQATVKDAGGNLVANAQVTFTAPGSGASGSFATAAVVTTNSSGVAAAPRFTANSTVGAYAVNASVAGVATPASFSLANTPGPPATITATGGTPQSALAATQYPAPLQATVKDASGNLIPNVQVTFTLPPAGPTATFAAGPSTVNPSMATSATNASGVATSPVFNANVGTGPFTGTATVPGLASPALFSLSNTANSSITTPAGLAITTTQLPPGTIGVTYGSSVSATGGTPPYSFSINHGTLPAGLSMLSTGIIFGTPTATGTQSFGVQVTDITGAIAVRGLTLTVVNPLLITTNSNLPNGTVGQSYSVTFQAIGGQPPYSWGISGGSVSPADVSSQDSPASTSGGLPPGLIFIGSSSTATLSGTLTAAGNFGFTVSVTDSAQKVAFKSFSLLSQSGTPGTPTGPPGIQVSQMGLSFQGPQGGNPPPPQYLSIVATNGQPLVATITIDSGSTGTPAPPWLKARFVSATTPARLAIQVMPTGLPAGPYTGRVLVTYQGQPTIVVNVSFAINLTPPSLAVVPGFLRFTTTAGVAAAAQQALLVSNLGTGGPLSFTASVVSGNSWLSVTPASGTTVVGSGVPLQVAVNTQGLAVGAYLGKITVAGPVGGSVDVPVSLFVSPVGPIITVNPVGVRFDARAGNGLAIPLPVTVLDTGTGLVNWAADLLAGQSWLSLSPASGQSTPTASSQLIATANPTGLSAGAYYALIRITDPQSLNSPQYAMVVLNVQPATVGPDADMEPGGLFFTATPGGSAPGPQSLQIFVSSDTPVPFQAAASSDNGGSWLSIGQPTGTAATLTPAQITVSVNPAGLKPGVYTGDVSVSFSSQTIRTANITLVVLQAGGSAASSSGVSSTGKDRGASCAPSQLSLTSTSLVNAFASPAGWPTPLIVRATDDCGNGAANAQVVATFSNGDPPLNLSRTDPTAALFSGTWAPQNSASQMTVTLNGLAPGLATATAQLTGAVSSNTAPVLSQNGTVNNLNPAPGAAVAPGTVAQVYGGSLTPSTTIPGLLPLPTLFNGTSVLVGAYLAPLYSLSGGQLDVQVPTELTPNRQYAILVSSGAAFTLPDTLTTTDVSPGLLNFAQHADFSTISASSPATAGETILLYLVGMGATDQTVASGAASPASPPANVTNPPAVTIDGQSATVSFAGLTPGLVGLYQINVQVPAGTASSSATVTVTQNGTPSNTVTIPIQ